MRALRVAFVASVVLLAAGFATATGPLPKKEVYVDPPSVDVALVRHEIFEKQRPIEEECTPRPVVVCVGPYDPDIDIQFGNTGARVISNDTNLTVGHDPARHWAYGPYTMYGVLDDLRLCNTPCKVPNSVYGNLTGGNITVVIYYFGDELPVSIQLPRREIVLHEPGLIEPTCEVPRWYDCTPLL